MWWKINDKLIDKIRNIVKILFFLRECKSLRLIRARYNTSLESAVKISERETYIHFRQVGQFFIIIVHRNIPNRCTISSL